MKKSQSNQLTVIRQVSDFLTQYRLKILKLSGKQEVLSCFQIQASGLFIINQHREILVKGISTDFPEMKRSLCRHVYEIAEFLYSGSSENDDIRTAIKKRPSINQLTNSRDHNLIKYCNRVFKTANKHHDLFSNAQINTQFIDSLKSATEMYNAVIPPPRTVLLQAKLLAKEVKQLEKTLTDMMNNELNDLILQVSSRSPIILSKYQLNRQAGA